jgi:putative methylase
VRARELVRELATLATFSSPEARLEQLATPPEAAAELLLEALHRGDLAGQHVLDLGAGTAILAIGASRLGAAAVVGVEADERALAVARANLERTPARVRLVFGDVADYDEPADTVVMNPPFGAQRRHADRPFWDRAFALARRAVYAFALADSRNFIQKRAVARGARIEETRPVRWTLPPTLPHHRRSKVAIPVDLWVFRTREGGPWTDRETASDS